MKRLLSLLVVAALLVAGLSMVAPATAVTLPETELYTLFTGKLSADKSTLTIEATLGNNPGIWSYQTLLSYNADALRLDAVNNGEVFAETGWYTCEADLTTNPVTYYVQCPDLKSNTYNEGLVATYVFTVLDEEALFNINVQALPKNTLGVMEVEPYDPIVLDMMILVDCPKSAQVSSVNVTIDGESEEYDAGSEIAIEAKNGAFYVSNRYAYRFDHWESTVEDCITDPTAANTTLVVPDTDVELTAVYYLVGDVNGDGAIDSVDVLVHTRILSGTVSEVPAADIDGDGEIGAMDLVLMKRYAAGTYVPSK